MKYDVALKRHANDSAQIHGCKGHFARRPRNKTYRFRKKGRCPRVPQASSRSRSAAPALSPPPAPPSPSHPPAEPARPAKTHASAGMNRVLASGLRAPVFPDDALRTNAAATPGAARRTPRKAAARREMWTGPARESPPSPSKVLNKSRTSGPSQSIPRQRNPLTPPATRCACRSPGPRRAEPPRRSPPPPAAPGTPHHPGCRGTTPRRRTRRSPRPRAARS